LGAGDFLFGYLAIENSLKNKPGKRITRQLYEELKMFLKINYF